MPAVCRFFLKGNCRYGVNCRYYHPGEHDNESKNSQQSQQFSFLAALNKTREQEQPQFTSGFSFTQTFNQIHQHHHDVDMNDIPILTINQSVPVAQPVLEYTEEELEAYAKPQFEFRRIPIRPPHPT